MNLPPFDPPATMTAIGLILMLQSKKSGKSTLSDIACSILVSLGYQIAAVRNDAHNRFDRYVKSTLIPLATTHDMIEGNISLDLDRHEVLIRLIEEMMARPRTAIVYDSSAAAGDRLPTILLRDLYVQQLAEHNRSALTLVPLRATDDIAAGALHAMESAEIALPGQVAVPVIIAHDAEIAALSRNHDFLKCVSKAKHGVIRLPYIPPVVASHVDRLAMPLWELSDPASLPVRRAVRDSLSCTQGQAGLVVAAVAEMVAIMKAELAKLDIGPEAV